MTESISNIFFTIVKQLIKKFKFNLWREYINKFSNLILNMNIQSSFVSYSTQSIISLMGFTWYSQIIYLHLIQIKPFIFTETFILTFKIFSITSPTIYYMIGLTCLIINQIMEKMHKLDIIVLYMFFIN